MTSHPKISLEKKLYPNSTELVKKTIKNEYESASNSEYEEIGILKRVGSLSESM